MLVNTEYNPDVDLFPVEIGLSLDINAALDSGVVIDTGVVPDFNEISQVDAISGRVRDAFEAIDVQRNLYASQKKPKGPGVDKVEGKHDGPGVSNQPKPAESA